MSGGAVKADPRCAEKTLKEREPQEGNGPVSALTGWRQAADRWSDKSLEVDAVGAGARGATLSQARTGNGKRAPAGDEPGWLASGKNP
jgi:hypothetical protein